MPTASARYPAPAQALALPIDQPEKGDLIAEGAGLAPETATMAPRELIAWMFRDRLQAELGDRFNSRELRLSESGGCARLRTAKAAGLAEEDRDVADAAYFVRGRAVEMLVRDIISSRFPHETRKEEPVNWAVQRPDGTALRGTGHMDMWFHRRRFILEIKSATRRRDGSLPKLPHDEHVKQVQAYLHFYRDARGHRRADEAVILYVILARGLEYHPFPVRHDPAVGAAIEAEMAEIDRVARTGDLPPVPEGYSPFAPPCVWKMPERARRCPIWETCWGAVDPKAPPAAVQGPLAEIVDEYAALWEDHHRAEDAAEAVAAIMEAKRDELDRVFAALDGTRAVRGGTHTITRVLQPGRESFDHKGAIEAGALDRSAAQPFIKTGEPSTQYRVRPLKKAAE